ncbi:ankyrin [Glonium stellatum]|uniref:Ankyrin n=1 Tax=Glonium stellatum TaxID=574774 RepID=A0A8E2F7Q4_9PEZI|nr:ankyrin [Glonium stellatum]
MAEVGAIASIFTIVGVAFRLSRYVSRIADEARDIKEAAGTISNQVVRWDEVLTAVHSSLKSRKKQRRFKPLNEDEEQIWLAVGNALERCQRTMKKFEEEIERLGNRGNYGWLRRGLIAMNSSENEPKVVRLENDMKADIASLGVLLPCFRPFEHEERLTVLRAGNAITKIYLPPITEAIKNGEIYLGRLSQPTVFQDTVHEKPEVDRDGYSVAQKIVGWDENYTNECPDLRTMKECLDAAVSFRDKISRAGSIIGQSSGDMSTQKDGNLGVPYTQSREMIGGHSNAESETDSSDESDGGGIPLYAHSLPDHAWTRHEIMGTASNAGESTENFPHNRDDTVPPEAIMNALIDNFKHNARDDFANGRYDSAERHLLDAIEYGKKRLEIYHFPFDEMVELREQLAEAYTKQEKFNEAEQEYLCLIGESRKSSDRYYAGNEKDCALFEVWEDYSMKSLNVASHSPKQGNNLLRRSAKLLVDLYEKQNKPAFATSYRELYLTTPQATPPPVHPILPTSFVSNSAHPISPVSSSFSSNPGTRSTSVNLISAIGEENIEKVSEFLQNGEDIEKLSETERLLLTQTLTHNGGSVVHDIRGGSTYSHIASSGEPALHYAARKGDLGIVQVLLGPRLRRPVDQLDQKEATPLLVAARCNRNRVVRYLLENGAHVGVQDKSGWTVLHHAIFGQGEDVDMLQYLLEKNADVNASNNEDETPLHFAIKSPYNKQKSAEILLRNDARIESRNKANKTALWLAVNGRKYDMVKLLIQKGEIFDEDEPLPETSQEISGLLKEEMKRRGISRRNSGNTTTSKRSIWKPLSRLKQGSRSG